MKKKIIIPICIVIVLLVIGVTVILLTRNKSATIINIEINPSIELHLDKKDKVLKVVPLNKDAKELIKNDYKGNTIEEFFTDLAKELKNTEYVNDNNLVLLVNSEGRLKTEDVSKTIEFEIGKQEIHAEIITIDKITKEDKKLAKEYGISPAKAAYINSISKDNDNIPTDTLKDKSIDELKNTKETGFYCDEGWTLEGDWCAKEIERLEAKYGETCPDRYSLINGKCYEEVEPIETNNFICREEFKKQDGKCIRTHSYNAEPVKYTCSKGEAKTRAEAGLTGQNDGDAKDIVCVDMSNATHPVTPCEANDGTEYTVAGGVCYWHRAPVIAAGCPGKVQVGGFCWDNATGIYICPGYRDGKQYKSRDEWCEHSIKYFDPTVQEYKCNEETAKLEGNKCIVEEIEDPQPERVCPSGSKKNEFERCISTKTIDKINGYYCEDPALRLEGSSCVRYDNIRAKQN